MATVDDVYNLLTDADHGLAAIVSRIGPTGWTSGNPTTGDWAKLAGDESLVGSPAYKVLQIFGALAVGGELDQLFQAFIVGGPDTLGDYIREARFAALGIISGYLKNPPDFDPGSNVLQDIWNAVHRDVPTG